MGDRQEMMPAIQFLISEIAELESRARAFRVGVNILCKHAGLPAIYPNQEHDQRRARAAGIEGRESGCG